MLRWIRELYGSARETPSAEFPALSLAMLQALPRAPGTETRDPASLHLLEATKINARLLPRGEGSSRRAVGRAVVTSTGRVLYGTAEFAALLRPCQRIAGQDGVLPRAWISVTGKTVSAAGQAVRLCATRIGEHWLLKAAPISPIERLTARERAIAYAYGGGKPYRRVAMELGLAPATVRNVVQRLYRKLRISSKVQLAALLDGRNSAPPV